MSRRLIFAVIGWICVFPTGGAFLTNQQTAAAQDCRIVRIHEGVTLGESKVRIEPEALWIQKGSCVIWFNRGPSIEVKVVFEEGKRCEDVTEAPTGFKLDAENCYVTSFIPLGGTSSLKFNEEGSYKYTVVTADGTETKGELVVAK